VVAAAVLAAGAGLWADEVLVDFGAMNPPPRSYDATTSVTVVDTADGEAVRMESERGNRPGRTWPSIAATAPGGGWDLSQYEWLEADVRNVGEYPVTVVLRIRNEGGSYKLNANAGRATVAPGRTGTIRTLLRKRMFDHEPVDLGELSLAYPLYANNATYTIDPTRVHVCEILVARHYRDYPFALEVRTVRMGGEESLPPSVYRLPEEPFPLIDRYGQFMHDTWPNKIEGPEDLEAWREREAADLARNSEPATWSRYGGYAAGPQLEATGHFRTEKHEGKWWLVDPEGKLFFSTGVNGVNFWSCITQIEDRRHWFEQVPGTVFTRVLPKSPFRSEQVDGDVTNVMDGNLARKYGEGWKQTYVDLTLRRLRSWGINTIGQGASPEFLGTGRIAYTFTLSAVGRPIEASSGPWSKFPDVFDESFEAALRRTLTSPKLSATREDPWCIGYYSHNELAWGAPITFAVWIMRSPADQTAKQVLVGDLKEAHGNEVAQLNTAWETDYESWDALLDETDLKALATERMRDDFVAFGLKATDRYFEVCKRAIEAEAPNKLYLGCRFAGELRPEVVDACARHSDVITYNLYKTSIEALRVPTDVDKPVMITEFNFSAADARYFYNPGFVQAALRTQDERAEAFTRYVTEALRDPRIVGCHWHRYTDDPPTGNLINENNQWGFVDICDTPYAEIIAASRALSEAMFGIRLGEEEQGGTER